MGFLQLNKNYHINKPVIIKLLEDPALINGLAKEYNGKTYLQFSIKVQNIGQEYLTKEQDSYKINAGQEVEFKMTDSLHQKIVNFQENELVYINMKPRSKGGYLWDIKPATGEDIEKLNKNHGVEDFNNARKNVNNDSRGLEIKWGMAFNNATRLVAQTTTSVDQKEMVDQIKRIIAPMFQVACGMDKTIDFINKKQKPTEKPTEKKTKEEIEDELF
ncbi:MAG: hypothetical protein Tp1102DCM295711_24 [Prokaryotic dsDNA virus sp.]|nr:MAG: hypothetical protein Tp1102DCM295711_24 [Prokaryotic dsDNA virus sp.]|tara:strand:+ start:15575 stop:16225 length:651 start_codon:yes stop_codon:yes gene_type:complete